MTATATTGSATSRLPNGVALSYTDCGDRDGVPLILVHGYSDSWRSFEPVIAQLPASIRAIAVSQRGHGDSDRPASGYAPADYASDLARFLDTLGIDRAVIAGHSMGSAVAQAFALDFPERTLGLVLIGATATWRGNVGLTILWNEIVEEMTDPIERSFVHEFQSSTLVLPAPDGFLDLVVDESLKLPARVWRTALRDLLDADHSARLADISAPTLVIWGDRDELATVDDQVALMTTLPRARHRVYAGHGHAPHWEDAGRVAADISAHLATIAN